jgi:hypothetical protein
MVGILTVGILTVGNLDVVKSSTGKTPSVFDNFGEKPRLHISILHST